MRVSPISFFPAAGKVQHLNQTSPAMLKQNLAQGVDIVSFGQTKKDSDAKEWAKKTILETGAIGGALRALIWEPEVKFADGRVMTRDKNSYDKKIVNEEGEVVGIIKGNFSGFEEYSADGKTLLRISSSISCDGGMDRYISIKEYTTDEKGKKVRNQIDAYSLGMPGKKDNDTNGFFCSDYDSISADLFFDSYPFNNELLK